MVPGHRKTTESQNPTPLGKITKGFLRPQGHDELLFPWVRRYIQLLKKLHVDRKKTGIPSSFFFFFPVSCRKEKKKGNKEENEMDHSIFKGNQIQDDQKNSEFVDKL